MSFAAETEKLANELIQAEYENACKNWGDKYNSLHEGWAVLKEECEEAKAGLKGVKRCLKLLWGDVTRNDPDCATYSIEHIEGYAFECMLELAQVLACCQKLKNTIKEG